MNGERERIGQRKFKDGREGWKGGRVDGWMGFSRSNFYKANRQGVNLQDRSGGSGGFWMRRGMEGRSSWMQ